MQSGVAAILLLLQLAAIGTTCYYYIMFSQNRYNISMVENTMRNAKPKLQVSPLVKYYNGGIGIAGNDVPKYIGLKSNFNLTQNVLDQAMIDVGLMDGIETVSAAKKGFTVFGFEPNPVHVDATIKTIHRHGMMNNYTFINCIDPTKSYSNHTTTNVSRSTTSTLIPILNAEKTRKLNPQSLCFDDNYKFIKDDLAHGFGWIYLIQVGLGAKRMENIQITIEGGWSHLQSRKILSKTADAAIISLDSIISDSVVVYCFNVCKLAYNHKLDL